MTTVDSLIKAQQITRLGQPLTIYGRIVGVCLKQESPEDFIISMTNAGVNWKDTIHIDDISVGADIKESRRDNEVFEKEDEGCEGGGCKI
jgi:hypothetical protein